MRPLSWDLIQYDWCPGEIRTWRQAQRKDDIEDTGTRQSSVSQREKPAPDPSLTPSSKPNPADILILDFQTPEL